MLAFAVGSIVICSFSFLFVRYMVTVMKTSVLIVKRKAKKIADARAASSVLSDIAVRFSRIRSPFVPSENSYVTYYASSMQQ